MKKLIDNTLMGADHWAYRLLSCPQEQLADTQRLIKAMRRWNSAILFPEQLLANARYCYEKSNTTLLHTVYAVVFATEDMGVDLRVRPIQFEMLRFRKDPTEPGKGQGTHVPRTALNWSQSNPKLHVSLGGVRHTSNTMLTSLENYLPWLLEWRKGNFTMNMMFGDREEALSYSQTLLGIQRTMYSDLVNLRGLDRHDWLDALT